MQDDSQDNLHTGAIEAVLAGNGLPEGGTNLVTL